MRKSTKLLTVAAALGFVVIGAGSAFTAGNTMPLTSYAGYGATAVTGTTVTGVHYVPDTAEPSKVMTVTFDDAQDLSTATHITLTLRSGSAVLASYPCTSDNTALITCDTSGNEQLLSDLAETDLTVIS